MNATYARHATTHAPTHPRTHAPTHARCQQVDTPRMDRSLDGRLAMAVLGTEMREWRELAVEMRADMDLEPGLYARDGACL